MRTLHVANFDFDDRLARPSLKTLPANLRAVNARLAPLLNGLCGPGDVVGLVGDDVSDAAAFDRVEPWGVEPDVVAWLRAIGVRPAVLDALPDPAAVRAVNSRRWQFAAERDLNLSAGGVTLRESADAARDAVAALAGHPRGWVVKAEHGGSGRGLRLGSGPLPPAVDRWVEGVAGRGMCLTVEPRDDRAWEYSAHLTVTDAGVTFDGVCFLHSTPTGRFRSVEPLRRSSDALAAAEPVWRGVAERARADGYRGFLGIDAAAAWGAVERPVRDVNARWTMGRLALATGRTVKNP